MECLSSPPSKKLRTSSNINIPMIECKREFSLPHKYPSTVTPKYNCVPNNNAVVTLSSTHTGNELGKGNLASGNNIKKLRIKTREGKDLGEVKVQFLSKNNAAGKQKLIYHMQPIGHRKNNSTKIPLVPSQKMTELLGSLSSKNPNAAPQLYVRAIPAKELPIAIKNKVFESDPKNKNVLQKHYILAKINKTEQGKQLLVPSEYEHKLLQNVPFYKEDEKTRQKNVMLLKKKRVSSDRNVAKKSTCTPLNSLSGNRRNASQNKMLSSKYQQLAASKFPVIRCEKLVIPKVKENTQKIISSSIKINDIRTLNASVQSQHAKSTSILIKNLQSLRPNDRKEEDNNPKEKKENFIEKKTSEVMKGNDNNDIIFLYDKREEQEKEKEVAQVSISKKVVHHEDKCTSSRTITRIPANNNEISHSSKNIEKTDSKVEEDICVIDKALETADVTKKKKLLECLDVIKQALISVKDEDLRAKALQALADCGIGVAKQIPITPSNQVKIVHDSQVQTDVFGLLEAQSFVLVKKNVHTLERIKQTERSTIESHTVNAATQTAKMEKQVQKKMISSNLIDNVDLFPMWSSVPTEPIGDIEHYFEEYFNGNKNVNKVKEVLSTPHSLYKKVAIQLEEDYKNLQDYNEEGMLNIHQAVINNHLRDVQRLILVLKASNTSIDIPTRDGMTSLELAVKFNVDKEMVNILLQAGAKPVIPEMLHESAILIASKLSSPMLSNLLRPTIDPEQLNQVDSLGFAALHYCSLNGNMDGTVALIQAGADVNLRDNRSGRTPFFHALENNHISIAKKLLENGATPDLPNFAGQSVLCLVDETKNLSLKAALKEIIF